MCGLHGRVVERSQHGVGCVGTIGEHGCVHVLVFERLEQRQSRKIECDLLPMSVDGLTVVVEDGFVGQYVSHPSLRVFAHVYGHDVGSGSEGGDVMVEGFQQSDGTVLDNILCHVAQEAVVWTHCRRISNPMSKSGCALLVRKGRVSNRLMS